MPEPIEEPRENAKLKTRVEELEKAVKQLLMSVKTLEEETDNLTIKKGVYLGISFED